MDEYLLTLGGPRHGEFSVCRPGQELFLPDPDTTGKKFYYKKATLHLFDGSDVKWTMWVPQSLHEEELRTFVLVSCLRLLHQETEWGKREGPLATAFMLQVERTDNPKTMKANFTSNLVFIPVERNGMLLSRRKVTRSTKYEIDASVFMESKSPESVVVHGYRTLLTKVVMEGIVDPMVEGVMRRQREREAKKGG